MKEVSFNANAIEYITIFYAPKKEVLFSVTDKASYSALKLYEKVFIQHYCIKSRGIGGLGH